MMNFLYLPQTSLLCTVIGVENLDPYNWRPVIWSLKKFSLIIVVEKGIYFDLWEEEVS